LEILSDADAQRLVADDMANHTKSSQSSPEGSVESVSWNATSETRLVELQTKESNDTLSSEERVELQQLVEQNSSSTQETEESSNNKVTVKVHEHEDVHGKTTFFKSVTEQDDVFIIVVVASLLLCCLVCCILRGSGSESSDEANPASEPGSVGTANAEPVDDEPQTRQRFTFNQDDTPAAAPQRKSGPLLFDVDDEKSDTGGNRLPEQPNQSMRSMPEQQVDLIDNYQNNAAGAGGQRTF